MSNIVKVLTSCAHSRATASGVRTACDDASVIPCTTSPASLLIMTCTIKQHRQDNAMQYTVSITL
jgi:hypothetical protein